MSFPDFRNFLILIRDRLFTRCLLAPHISLFFCRREVNPPMSIIIKCFWFDLWTKAIYLLSFSIGVPLQESRNTISCRRIRILQKSHLLLDSNFQSQHLLREVDMSVVLACGHAFICFVFFFICDLRCKWHTYKRNYFKTSSLRLPLCQLRCLKMKKRMKWSAGSLKRLYTFSLEQEAGRGMCCEHRYQADQTKLQDPWLNLKSSSS